MLFNSYIFLFLFLPLTLIGYYLLGHWKQYRLSSILLVGMSLWFYAYFNPSYLWLIVVSMLGNYLLAYGIERIALPIWRRIFVILGLVLNLGMLFFYKYYDFFVDNTNAIFGTQWTLHYLILPLGISFFTFQQLSYLIDCYRKEAPLYGFWDYVAFVTFFPQLIAGPIVLHSEFLPQYQDLSLKKINGRNMVRGIYAFSLGLAKKVLLADTFGLLVNKGYGDVYSLDATGAILVALAYTLQLYFDYSGYSDMAYGLGYMFNIELPVNFRSPYKSASVTEFWTRWHVTLNRFFIRYIYIPLGGSRKGKARKQLNMFLVFVVSGIWHGANWTFIVWGILSGAANVVDSLTKKWTEHIPRPIRVVLTYAFFTLSVIIFRSRSLQEAWIMFGKVFGGEFGSLSEVFTGSINELAEIRILCRFGLQGVVDAAPWLATTLLMAGGLAGVWFLPNTQDKVDCLELHWGKLLVTVSLLLWSVMSLSGVSEFLYFNF